MRALTIIILLLTSRISFSQDTNVTWIKNIDTYAFKLLYDKRDIPKEFYSVLSIEDLNTIANPSEEYSPGCTNPIRGQLNWIAKQKSRWIISITYGGKGVCNRFFFFDKDNGELNINEMNFLGPKKSGTTIREVVTLIKSGQYEFEE